MSNDKYPGIFWRQMETTVFIILQIFFASRSVLKIGEILGCSPNRIFGHVMRLYQTRVSETWIFDGLVYQTIFRAISQDNC